MLPRLAALVKVTVPQDVKVVARGSRNSFNGPVQPRMAELDSRAVKTVPCVTHETGSPESGDGPETLRRLTPTTSLRSILFALGVTVRIRFCLQRFEFSREVESEVFRKGVEHQEHRRIAKRERDRAHLRDGHWLEKKRRAVSHALQGVGQAKGPECTMSLPIAPYITSYS
jgi:hypothetical protein